MTATAFVIEGLDRLGKGTLIENIQQECGFRMYYHYEKPKSLAFYKQFKNNLETYQLASFEVGFQTLASCIPVIFDRFHLGETVYSPRYRNYSGDYVFDLEEKYGADEMTHVKMILLTTSNFDFIVDDGLSFDFSKKGEEQKDFISAFNKSIFPNKIIIDVHDGHGSFKDPKKILAEALHREY
jgi:thymidylate kinase